MPRFGISHEFGSPPPPLPSFSMNTSPATTMMSPTNTNNNNRRPPSRRPSTTSASVRLSCVSPDGRCLLSMLSNEGAIEIRRLPITEHEERDDDDFPPRLEVPLPSAVRAAVAIDPVVEVLCVVQQERHPSSSLQRLPSLCLVTCKTVFLLELAYPKADVPVDQTVRGTVLSVRQPFERLGAAAWSWTIVRVRPAPQQALGYATLCPSESLMLLACSSGTEYSLSLYHASTKQVTTPLVFRLEDQRETIVDFCVAQSQALSLLSSVSVLLLKNTGDVLAATPIVVDGSIVSRTDYKETVDFLWNQGHVTLDPETAKWRQCWAALTYIQDLFHDTGNFMTARIGVSSPPSIAWPVQLQGPILFPPSDHDDDSALATTCRAIECFGNCDLVGFAIAKTAGKVDFAVTTPTTLIPRFALEHRNDYFDLEEEICKMSVTVERVAFGGGDDGGGTRSTETVALIRDPSIDTLLHYVTPTALVTIATDAVRTTSLRLQKGPGLTQTRTTAWCNLTVSQGALEGAVVLNDAFVGHQLLARHSDGSLYPMDVTEMEVLRKLETAVADRGSSSNQRMLGNSPANNNVPNDALVAMEATKPLHAVIAPMLSLIQRGIAAMGKIVGSETAVKDVSPEMMAVSMHIYGRCNELVFLPLLELKRVVKKRREKLEAVVVNQHEQVKVLLQTLQTLKAKAANLSERLESAESNALTLAQRSAAALQASQDLLPTITQAEFDFFQDIRRLDVKSATIEEETNNFVLSKSNEDETDIGSNMVMSMDPKTIENVNKMLSDEALTLTTTKDRLERTEASLLRVMRRV